MKRVPSIHISKKTFDKIAKDMGLEIDSDEFFILARKYSLDHRTVSISNQKIERDIKKRTLANKGDTDMLADVIYSVRISMKHRGVRKINMQSRDWLQLKQLTGLVNDFCEEFNLEKRKGYIEYVQLGIKKIQSMSNLVTKLINMYETISKTYSALDELNNWRDMDSIINIHNYYVNTVADKTGIMDSYTNKPDKMVIFKRIADQCLELSVNYEDYIDAQFKALDWANDYPSVEALVGDKAIERLNKFLYKKPTKISRTIKADDLWEQLG